MSRRLVVRRRDPPGSPQRSGKGEFAPQSSPRTTASPRGSAWQQQSSTTSTNDPHVTALASPPPPSTPPSSFLEQLNRTPESELPPESGALQFVPAFQMSSWSGDDEDHLLREEKKEEHRSTVSSTFAHRARAWKKARARSTVETPTGKNNTRIARLASLFSSRAVVKGEMNGSQTQPPTPQYEMPQQNQQAIPDTQPRRQPPSPAPSSGSSGYVGWPGTQDKGGRTVSLPSSYDDSSSAAGARPSPPPSRAPVSRPEYSWNEAVTPKRSLSSMQYERRSGAQQTAATTEHHHQQQDVPKEPIFWQHFPEKSWPDAPSSPSTVDSKTSSAYFQTRDVRQLAYPDLDAPYGVTKDLTASILRKSPIQQQQQQQRGLGLTQPARSASSSRTSVPNRSTVAQAPTEERLAANNHLAPPHRPFAAAKGYSGLIQKTQEVPSLMDDVNDSDTSSRATSAVQSDVFDGISTSDVFDNLSSPRRTTKRYPERIKEEEPDHGKEVDEEDEFKLVMLGGGLTVIQSSAFGFDNRVTASDYDDNLTNSDVDQRGYARTPDLKEMLTAGISGDSALSGIHGNFGSRRKTQETTQETVSESSASSIFTDPYTNSVMDMDGDLAEYYIEPSQMKKVLRKFRELGEGSNVDMSLAELEKAEDENKAFALFEMRSRIMEKDIERGLERRGGTVVVDDLVTTPYYRTAHRIRDAVIVAKAWRDGASPHDVINTSILTRRSERSYFIKRPLSREPVSRYSRYSSPRHYWEAVRWTDDTDFMLYRCPSLGPRNLRGFEMFTVGDCQSILLKLTNERCMELRAELNEATKRQIQAEEIMKAEGDDGDGMMTEAEMTYLTAMEEVKTISKHLVVAEQSFALVRDRVEKLVAKYQSLLLKIETESFTGASSIVTYTSSYYSDHDSAYWDEEEAREAALWARRARRAEIKAEVAAREALLARQEARMVREEKEQELESLRQKLNEMQSETSHAISEREHLLVNRIAPQPLAGGVADRQQTGGMSEVEVSEKKKLDGVKQRFRDRMAARKKMSEAEESAPNKLQQQQQLSHQHLNPRESYQASFVRTAGEEMYQQLDFYERSLKAVDRS